MKKKLNNASTQYMSMNKNLLALLIMTILITGCKAQSGPLWNGKKCSVVLTYDDAIDQHLDNAVPILDSLGFKATFYITAFSNSMKTRLNDWEKVASKGHELGNHTLYHPCNGGPGREWVKADYDMRNYTVQRMVDETRMTNIFLQALDGKTKRTFAYTCGDMKIHDTSFIELMKDDFVAARAVRDQLSKMNDIDLYKVNSFVVNGQNGDQLIEWVKNAAETQSLLVILFHGVDGGNALNVSLAAHRQFMQYLKKNEKEIWIATMLEVAEYVKNYQSR